MYCLPKTAWPPTLSRGPGDVYKRQGRGCLAEREGSVNITCVQVFTVSLSCLSVSYTHLTLPTKVGS
ncbi:hypothetical protein R51_37890 [Bacillus safensis]|nr:hypothetical protein R51_37890 [Bacillus safensis]